MHFVSLCRAASVAFVITTGVLTSTALADADRSHDTKSKDSEAHKSVSKPDNFSSSTLQTQVLLDRILISPGAIDGVDGSNASRALTNFQLTQKLKPTGKMDEETSAALLETAPDLDYITSYKISEEDAAAPLIGELPEKMEHKAGLEALGYETPQEFLAERFHSKTELLERLNPEAQWKAGESILVPNIIPTDIRPSSAKTNMEKAREEAEKALDEAKKAGKKRSENDAENADAQDSKSKSRETSEAEPSSEAALKSKQLPPRPSGIHSKPMGDVTIIVTKEDAGLSLIDKEGHLLFHAPVSAGSEHDPLPLGDWKINGTERYPKYHYNPELFWDAEKSDKKALLPAGPNSPVGVAWIDLSKPHYGIHGTPNPEKIGYTESHGCVRLSNWDVLRLADLVKPGTKVQFLETTEEGQKLIRAGDNPLLKDESESRSAEDREKSETEPKNEDSEE